MVAGNFEYQGNSSGGWQVDRWTRVRFYDHGWLEATAKELGGVLVDGGNRKQVIFVKKVAAGERGRLRCNQYDPPYLMVCSNEPVKQCRTKSIHRMSGQQVRLKFERFWETAHRRSRRASKVVDRE